MKRKEKAVKLKRHASPAFYLFLLILGVAMIWPVDALCRRLRKPPVAYPPGQGIVSEGVFASPGNGPDAATLEKDPEEAAKTAGEPEEESEPSTEFVVKEASAPVPGVAVPENCVAVPLDTKEISNGKLLLLDGDHAFSGSNADLVDFSGKSENYLMRVNDMPIKSEVVDALNKMTAAYVMVMERTDLMIYSTTEPVSDVCLYPEAMPDSATGYCVDVCIYTEEGDIVGIRENSPWLTNNAHLYGFVRSYTTADEEVTGVASAPHHLRYVGKVHSMIMHEQGLTLTAYIDSLSKHPISDPYYWTDGSTTWSVYYVPATAGQTQVPVPLNANYEISGNNVDGFIVTAEGKIGS
ncbi:MAG: D-alanyl-D-alanine carboxypeptidase family protein [Oscillospiraceae bacterium]|nr:D-alanyl-D-alanine carboxypeptidase family protein [Oscillospiraceae bacterium]